MFLVSGLPVKHKEKTRQRTQETRNKGRKERKKRRRGKGRLKNEYRAKEKKCIDNFVSTVCSFRPLERENTDPGNKLGVLLPAA